MEQATIYSISVNKCFTAENAENAEKNGENENNKFEITNYKQIPKSKDAMVQTSEAAIWNFICEVW